MNGPEIVFGTSGTVANIKQVNIAFDQMAAASEKATTKAASSVESMSKWLKTATADIKKAENAFNTLGGMKGVNLDHLKKMLGHLKDLKQPLTEAESRFIRLSKQIEFFNAKLEHSARVQKLWLVQQTAQMDAVFKTQSALAKLTAEYAVLKSAEGLELANMKAMTEARKRLNAALAANTKVTIRDNAAAKVNQAEADSAVKLRTAIEMLAIKTKEYQGLIGRGAQVKEAEMQVSKAHYESLVRERAAMGLLNIQLRESKKALDDTRLAKEAEIAANKAYRQTVLDAAKAEAALKFATDAKTAQKWKDLQVNQTVLAGMKEEATYSQRMVNKYKEMERALAYLRSEQGKRASTLSVEAAAQKKLNDLIARSTPEMRALTAQIAKLEAQERALRVTTDSVATSFMKSHQSAAALRSMLSGMGAAFGSFTSATMLMSVAVFALSRALKDVIASGANYEDALARVGAVASQALLGSQAYADSLAALNNEAIRISSTSRFMAGEVMQAMNELAMAGMKVEQILMATADVMELAAIGATGFGEAADIATNIMMGFQLPIADLSHVVDVMAVAVTNSNQNISQMGNAMSYVAPVASAFGVSLEFVAASTEVLANSGIKASRAGTGLRRIISSIFTPTQKGAEAMKAFGVSTREVQEGMEDLEGLEGAIPGMFKGAEYSTEALVESLKRLYVATDGATKNMSLLKDVSDIRALPAFIQLIKSMDDGEKGLLALADGLKTVTGASDEMFQKMQTSLKSDWLVFLGALDSIKKRLFEANGNSASDWLKGITAPFQVLAKDQELMEEFVRALKQTGAAILELIKLFVLLKAATAGYAIWTGMATAIAVVTNALVQLRTATAAFIVVSTNLALTSASLGGVGAAASAGAIGFSLLAKAAGAFLLRFAGFVAIGAVIYTVVNQFVDLNKIIGTFFGLWDGVSERLKQARIDSQDVFTGLTEGGGLKALLEQKATIEDNIAALGKQAQAGGNVADALESELHQRDLINRKLQEANQAIKDHAQFYMIEQIAEASVKADELRESLRGLREDQEAYKDPGLFTRMVTNLTSVVTGDDKSTKDYSQALKDTEDKLKIAEANEKAVRALQASYAGTDAGRMEMLKDASLGVDEAMSVLLRQRKAVETELNTLKDALSDATGGDKQDIQAKIQTTTEKFAAYNEEIKKLTARMDELKVATSSVGKAMPGSVETATKMAKESLAAYDAMLGATSVSKDEKAAKSLQSTIKEVENYQKRITELRNQIAAAQSQALNGTDEEQRRFITLVSDLGTELREVTKIYNDKSLDISETLQALNEKFDPVIAKANSFKSVFAELVSADMGRAISDSSVQSVDDFSVRLREQAKSIYEVSEVTGTLTKSSEKAAKANLSYVDSQIASARANNESEDTIARLVAARQVLSDVLDGSIRTQMTEDQAIEAAAKTRELQLGLLEAQGRSYEALTGSREKELIGLTEEDKLLKRATFAAQDAAKTRGLQIDLMEAQGQSYAALQAARTIELEGLSAEDQGLRKATFAAQDAAKTRQLQIGLIEAQGYSYQALQASRELEIQGLSEEDKLLKQATFNAQDAAKTRQLESELLDKLGLSYVATARRREDTLKGMSEEDQAIQKTIYFTEDLIAVKDQLVKELTMLADTLEWVFGNTTDAVMWTVETITGSISALMGKIKEVRAEAKSIGTATLEAQGYSDKVKQAERKEELKSVSWFNRGAQKDLYAAQDEAKSKSLLSDLTKELGYNYNALQKARDLELRGLSAEDQATMRLIYAAQDGNALRALTIKLLEAQGESYQALQMTRQMELRGLSDEQAAIAAQVHATEDMTATRNLVIDMLDAQGESYATMQIRRTTELQGLTDEQKALVSSKHAAEDRLKTRNLEIDLLEAQGEAYRALQARREANRGSMSREDFDLQKRIDAMADLRKAYESVELEAMNVPGGGAQAQRLKDLEELRGKGPLEQGAVRAAQAMRASNREYEAEISLLQASGREHEALILIRQREANLAVDAADEQAIRERQRLEDVRATRELEISLMEATGRSYEALTARRQIEITAASDQNKALLRLIHTAQDEETSANLRIGLLEAQGRAYEALQARRDQELRQAAPQDRGILQATYAAQDYAAAQDKLVAALERTGQAQAAMSITRERELREMNAQLRPMQEMLNLLEDLNRAQETAMGLSNLSDQMFDSYVDLSDEMKSQLGSTVNDFFDPYPTIKTAEDLKTKVGESLVAALDLGQETTKQINNAFDALEARLLQLVGKVVEGTKALRDAASVPSQTGVTGAPANLSGAYGLKTTPTGTGPNSIGAKVIREQTAEVKAAIAEAEATYKLYPGVLDTIKLMESGVSTNLDIRGPQTKYGRARGIMQMLEGTISGFEVDMTSIAGQIDGAARYVQRSIKENEGNVQQVFAEYVGGHAAKMSTIGEYGRNYVDAAMKIYNILTSAPEATAVASNSDALNQNAAAVALVTASTMDLTKAKRDSATAVDYSTVALTKQMTTAEKVADLEKKAIQARREADTLLKQATLVPDGSAAQEELLKKATQRQEEFNTQIARAGKLRALANKEDELAIALGEKSKKTFARTPEEIRAIGDTYNSAASATRKYNLEVDKLREAYAAGELTADEFTKSIEDQTNAMIAAHGPIEEYWVNLKKSIPTPEELGIELFDDLKGKLVDALVDGGEFKMDDFVKMVKRKLAEIAVNTIIVNIVGNITGLTGRSNSLIGDAMSAIGGGGQGGLLSNLSSLSGIKNLLGGTSVGTGLAEMMLGGSQNLMLAQQTAGMGVNSIWQGAATTLAGIPTWALGLGSIGGSLLGSNLFGNKGYSGIGSSVGSLAGSVGGASMSALLGAVGSIVPGIGTIIGGLLGGIAGGGLGSLFGGDKTPRQGSFATSFSGYGFEDNAKAKGAFGLHFGLDDRYSKNIDGAQFQDFYDGMAQVSNTLAQFYGTDLATQVQIQLRESLGDFKGYGPSADAAFGEIFQRIIDAASQAEGDVGDGMGHLMKVAVGSLQGTTEQMAAHIENSMARVKTAISLFDTDIGEMLGMGTGKYYDTLEKSIVALSGYVDQFRTGVETLPETLTRIVTGLGVLQMVADATNMSLENLNGNQLIEISQKFIKVMNDMGIAVDQLAGLQESYNNVFLTEQQRAEMQIKNSVSELKKWNEATKVLGDTQIDSTTEWEAARAAIKKYTEGLDLTTEAGMKAYLAVLQLSSSFGQLGEAIESLKSTKVQDFVDSITPDYVGANEMLKMFKDWGIVIPETSEALYNMIKANVFSADQLEILANNADKLGTMWSYIADQIGKARDELLKAAQKAYDLKVEAENERYDKEVEKIREDSDARKEALRDAYDAKVEAINDEIEKLTDAIADFKSAFEASTKALRSLLELTDGPDQTRQRYVTEALAAIESLKKGIVPKNIEDIISGLSSVDQNDFANREDWLKAVEENKKLLEQINSLTGGKTDSMQAQIDLLKEQLETEKKNFDAAMKAEDDRLEKELKEAEKLHKATLDSLEKEFEEAKTAIENASLSELTEMVKTNGTLGSILAVLEAIRDGKPINPNPDDGKSLWNNNDAIRKPIWADILKMAFPDLSIEEIYKQGLTDPEGMTFTDAFDKLAKLIPYWSQKGLLDSDEMQKIVEMLAKIGIKLPEQNSLYDPKANADLLKAVMDVVTKGGTVGVTMPQIGADNEAGLYKKLLEIWKEQGQVDDAMYAALVAILKTFNVPGFAKGGLHKGGLRLVGERGPELEYTGPSRIFSNDDLERFFNMAGVQDPDYSQYRIPSSGPTNDDALLAEVRSLREEVKALRNDTNSGNRAVATNTGKVVAMTERWEQIGMPQSRSDIYETP